jgi:2-methylcitrate dehydratase PrpD
MTAATPGIAPGASAVMGAFVADFPSADIPQSQKQAARLSLLDTLCAVSLGTASELGAKLLACPRGGRVRVPGTIVCEAPAQAALLFGALAHAQDIDDWAGYGAAGAPVWGALLALAQAEGIGDLPRLIDAYCVGVEVALSLWQAGRYCQADRGLDGTGVFGTVASAAASARLLRLDAERTVWAIAIAGSHFGGVIANLGTEVGALHAGFAARNGLQSALLARAGFYGADDVLEARQGLGEACFGPVNGSLAGFGEVLGRPFKLVGTLRFRHSPCAIDHQRPVAALRHLMTRSGLQATDIAEAGVDGVPPTSEGVRIYAPVSAAQARASLRCSLACALLDVPMLPSPLSDARRRGEVADAMARVWVQIAPRWDPRLRTDQDEATRVWVRTGDGEVLSSDPRDEALSLRPDELVGKWRAAAASLEPGSDAAAFLHRASSWFDGPDTPDLPATLGLPG